MKKFSILIIIILLMSISASSALFDHFEEHTDSVSISDFKTEFATHTDGWYVYSANFNVNNLSSEHGITVKVSFWNGNKLIKTNYDNESEDTLDNDYSSDEYKTYLGKDSKNPDLNPIRIDSHIERTKKVNLTHVKISVYDNTAGKLLYRSVEKFNMSNKIKINDELERIEGGAYIDAKFSWDSKDLNLFDKIDSDNNHLITFNEFEKIKNIEKYDYLKTYSKSELKEEFDNLDGNKDSYLTTTEFKSFI